jgi:outer membrane protein OmpA-like peptidoglycan-associated protein
MSLRIKGEARFLFYIFAPILFISCVGRTPVGPPPPGGYYKNEPVVFNGSYDEVWSATIAALQTLDWRIQSQDVYTGKIQFETSYVYSPKFGERDRIYVEPTNEQIKDSKVMPYLRQISYFDKLTPPPAPPNPKFVKEKLRVDVKSLSPSETEVKLNYKIVPFFDYKIGYLGTVRSRGFLEKTVLNDINDTLMKKQMRAQAVPEAPPAPSSLELGLELRDIFFDFDKSDIRPDAIPVLQENAKSLRDNPGFTLLIQGYADIRGTAQYNLALALRRANAAKNFLIGLGIDPVRIVAVSKGATTKFAPGTTEEAYQLNRRDRFIPIKPGTGTGALTSYRTNE